MREAISLRSLENRPLLVAAGVVILALILALANPRGLLPHKAAPARVPPAPIVAIVAARPIAAGTIIAAADIRARSYSAGAPPAGALNSRNAVLGRAAARAFAPGEVLLRDDLRDPATMGIAMRLPAGERAFSIRVTEDEIVGGLLQSGDHVDVFATIPGSVFPAIGAQKMPDRSQALLLLQNVQVLAVGQNTATHGAVQSDARTVSLSLSPEGLARLALALRFGKVALAVRKPGDDATSGPVTVTFADLFPGRAAPAGRASRRAVPFYAGAHSDVSLAEGRP